MLSSMSRWQKGIQQQLLYDTLIYACSDNAVLENHSRNDKTKAHLRGLYMNELGELGTKKGPLTHK